VVNQMWHRVAILIVAFCSNSQRWTQN